MSTFAEQYRKLGGTGMQAAGHSRLYLGGDHILQVSAAGFSERYKRFYFRDIQALVVMPNNWWMVEVSVLAALCAGTVGIALANLDEPVLAGVFAGIGAVLIGFFIWSLTRGQSCRTHIRTAVQMEVLPSLNRIRKAKRIIATLQPLIETSQSVAATTPEGSSL